MNGRRRTWSPASAACARPGTTSPCCFTTPIIAACRSPASIEQLPLQDYDAVLAFGETLRRRYERLGWGRRVFTWHEAADTSVFRPLFPRGRQKDLVWIGNWGDGERAQELHDFLIEPAREARLDGTVHGVRYPPEALDALAATGIAYQG